MFECWIKPLPKACYLLDEDGNEQCCPFLQLDENNCVCMLLKNGAVSDDYILSRKTLHRKPGRCPLQYASASTIKTVTKVREIKPEKLVELETTIKELKEQVRTQKSHISKLENKLNDTSKKDSVVEELNVYKVALYNRVKKSCVAVCSSKCSIENKITMIVNKELSEARKQISDKNTGISNEN